MKFTRQTLKRMLRTFFQTAIGVVAVGISTVDFTAISAAKTGLIALGASAFSAGISALMNLESDG
jgi:hypothetical protein